MEPANTNPHDAFMRICIELAQKAKARGDSPVGALLVRNNEIIGKGVEGGKSNYDITFHAEMEAIRRASRLLMTQDLSGSILYTTHEPCIMCAYMIRHVKISTVVAGITSGEIGGFSSAYPLLKDTGIKKWDKPPGFISGVLEKECRALNNSL